MPVWPIALATLPAGFAVAEITGNRPVGGVVLIVAGLSTITLTRAPLARRVSWGLITFAGFALSHPLAGAFGPWGSVAAMAAISGASAWLLLDSVGSSL